MATPSLTRTKKPLASGASASPTLGQGDPLKQALQGAPAPASAPTKSGMIAISPNVEQAKTQWDYMQNSGNPLYSNANFGGINIPVNNVTGNPLSLDRRDYETRQATNQIVDARLRDRAMTTPYKQHYGTGLGTGVAPINVLAEDYRKAAQEADFEQLRAENRAAFDRAQSMSPTKYKVGRSNDELRYAVERGGEAGAQAQRMLDARAAIDAREEAKRELKAQRGIEMGNAQAAARTFRMTGVSPNQGFTDQLMARMDPRGAWDARASQEASKLQQALAAEDRAYKDRALQAQIQSNAQANEIDRIKAQGASARDMSEAEVNKLKQKILAEQSGVSQDTNNPIPGQMTPEQSATFSNATSQYQGLKGSDLFDALGGQIDMIANTDPAKRSQAMFQAGITPRMLQEYQQYRPMIPFNPLSSYSRIFGESSNAYSERLRRQKQAEEFLKALGG